MNKKLLEIIIGSSLVLMLLTFNPFISPGIYFDSTNSYRFISMHKVPILLALDFILLLIWALSIFKKKDISFVPSNFYVIVLTLLGSSVVSFLLSINQTNSLFGFNSTLGNSLVEMCAFVVFVLLFVNIITSKESLIRIIRYFNFGIVLAVVWILLRFAFGWNFSGNIFVRDYLNSAYFSPTGHYGSLVILTLSAFLINLIVIYTDINLNKKRIVIYDIFISILLGVGFVNFLNYFSDFRFYAFATLGIVSILFIAYLISNVKELRNYLYNIGIIFISSIVLGILAYTTTTKKVFNSFAFPPVSNVSIDNSWDTSIKTLNTVKKGLFGIGQGNYTYAFDSLKPTNSAANNLTINNNKPSVGEFRTHQSESFLIGFLSSNGILGLGAFLTLIILTIYSSFKKYSEENNLIGTISLVSFICASVGLMLLPYDFSLLLLFWLSLGINFVILNIDKIRKVLSLSFSNDDENKLISDSKNKNYSVLIPLTLILISLPLLFAMCNLTSANVSMFWAKRFEQSGSLEKYRAQSLKAVNKYPSSDVFIRELANSNGIALIGNLQELQKKLEKEPEAKKTQEFNDQVLALSNYQDGIISNLQFAINKFPLEYKNFYTTGLILTEASKYTNLAYDNMAVRNFNTARALNPQVPDIYYQLALIMQRNKDFASAREYILMAAQLDQNNISYKFMYADVLAQLGDYDNALKIYEEYEKIYKENPTNKELKNIYEAFSVAQRIEEIKKLKSDGDKKKEEKPKEGELITPETNPSPSLSPTPSENMTITVTPSISITPTATP